MSKKISTLSSPPHVASSARKITRLSSVGLLALTLATACGGSEAPPSCFDAFNHYYAAGCNFFYLDTGDVVPVSTLIQDCRDTRSIEGSSCQDAVDDFLICLDAVPSNSTTDAECNCSEPQERMLQACS